MVTEEHFAKAVSGTGEAAQKAAQYASVSGRRGRDKKRETLVFPEKHEGLRTYTKVHVAGTGFEPATSRL